MKRWIISRGRALVIYLCFLLAGLSAVPIFGATCSQVESFDIRGVKLGMTLSQARKLLPLPGDSCATAGKCYVDVQDEKDNVYYTVWFFAEDPEKRVFAVTLTYGFFEPLDTASAEQLFGQIKAKYGPYDYDTVAGDHISPQYVWGRYCDEVAFFVNRRKEKGGVSVRLELQYSNPAPRRKFSL